MIGRQYLRVLGWFALALNSALLAFVARLYFAGELQGSKLFHHIAGIAAGFVISGILIFAAKSK